MILDCVQNDGNTMRDYQASKDFITQSLVRDLEHQVVELAQIETEIEKMLESFDYKLTTLPSVGNAIASKLIAEIGDIRRFPIADKLACFAEIAPKASVLRVKAGTRATSRATESCMVYFTSLL